MTRLRRYRELALAWCLLLACLSGVVSARDDLDISLEGTLVCQDGRYAIVRAPNGKAYLARMGETLGPYAVLAIDRSQIVLGYGSRKFPIAMAGEADAAIPPGPSLRLQGPSFPMPSSWSAWLAARTFRSRPTSRAR